MKSSLKEALVKNLFRAACCLVLVTNAQAASMPIASAKGVRQLSASDAERALPVELEGVVLVFNRMVDGWVVHDGATAIYLDGPRSTNSLPRIQPGDRVRVTGVTSPGDFAPMALAKSVEVIGRGELPAPRDCTFAELAAGALDGQWVRVSGIVRRASFERLTGYSRLSFDLAMGAARLTIRVPQVDALETENLIASKATVTGICFPVFNRRRQLLAVRLRAPGLDHVVFEPPADRTSYDSPSRPINSLMQFESAAAHGQRVKIEGVVTMQKRGEFLFVRDATQGLWIKSNDQTILAPGDRVEAMGFPAFGDYNPVLEDAVFRKVGVTTAPAPRKIRVESARNGDHDADLVELEGTVLDASFASGAWNLSLANGACVFNARLVGEARPEPIVPGSRVQIAGICLVQAGTDRAPQTFRLLLRSATDVVVLARPSWWTAQRLSMALSLVSLVLIAVMVWVGTLRYRVRAQTAEIQSKAEREAVLEERTRIAREFHDTIEQQLAAVTLQVQVARTQLGRSTEAARRVLQVAESMLRHTQSEARHSVWDLRARALETGALPAALHAVAAYVRNGHPVDVQVDVVGVERALPGPVENHLLRIAQEATANAIRHGGARRVRIVLNFADSSSVGLVVEDDGNGFDADSAITSQAGHFGLLGMRERAEKIGGELSVRSAPAAGARIEVRAPLSAPTESI